MRRIAAFFLLLASCNAAGQNKLVSTGVIFDGEPYIVINPDNDQHMVVAWMGLPLGQPVAIRTRVTFNGGITWSPVVALPHAQPGYGSADPSLAFDAEGAVVACYIDYINEPTEGGVYLVKSTNGGLSWGPMLKAIDAFDDELEYPVDRPWFSVNPLTNHYYLTSMSAYWGPTPNYAYFTASADGGLTWSVVQRLGAPGFIVGNFIGKPMPVNGVSSNGILHILYPSWVPANNLLPGVMHAQSINHGETFSYNAAFYSNAGGGNDPGAKNGYRLVVNPANPNHLALLLPLSPTGDQDIYLRESYDGGSTWGSSVRVNDDPSGNGRMQDLVWASFDTDGDLAIAWRDRRNAPETGYATSQEIYGAVKWNGAESISPNFPISSATAPWNATFLDQSGNDFLCVEMRNDTLNTVWGDVRNNKLEIWFQRTDAHTGLPVSIFNLTDERATDILIYPNPASEFISVKGFWTRCVIHDATGKLLREIQAPSTSISVSDLPTGYYTAIFNTQDGISVHYFQIQR